MSASIKDPALRNLMAARCTVCGQYFASDSAFQRHRYTDTATGRRKCLTPRQMDRLGMTKGARNLRLWGDNLRAHGCETVEEFAEKY
jgi:hypothetical protein